MGGFGSMKTKQAVDTPPADEAVDTVVGAGTVSAPAEPVAAEAPATPAARPIMGRPTGRAVAAEPANEEDDILGDFAGAPPAPEDDKPAAKAAPAPASPASGIEGSLAARVVSPDVEALARAHASEKAPPGNAEAPGDSGAPKDGAPEQDNGPAVDAEPGPGTYSGQTTLDSLRALNLGRSQEILDELLRAGGLDEEDIAQYSAEVVRHFDEHYRPRFAKIDGRDKAKVERLLQEAEQEAARAAGASVGGGGLLSGLLGRLLPRNNPVADAMKQVDALGNKRRKLVDKYSGFADGMSRRIRNTLARQYFDEMEGITRTANTIARAVVAHNLAVMEASPDFKKAVELEAQASGRTVDEVIIDLGKGGGSEELRKAMVEAAKGAADNPEVVKAKKAILQQEEILAEHNKRAAERLETRIKNDPSIDPKASKDHMTNVWDMVQEDMPKPFEDPEAKRQLAERMREMAEAMQQAISGIMARLAERLVPGHGA